jgi:hypothetical protein
METTAETIEESGRRLGGHAWVEMRLFEMLGRWSGDVDEPRARVLLAATSRHHARHAEMWIGLLPGLPHLPPADLVAPGEGAAAMVAALDELDDAPTTDRLTALVAVALPQVIDRLAAHLDRTVAIADAPAQRALRLALTEVRSDRDELASLLAQPADG